VSCVVAVLLRQFQPNAVEGTRGQRRESPLSVWPRSTSPFPCVIAPRLTARATDRLLEHFQNQHGVCIEPAARATDDLSVARAPGSNINNKKAIRLQQQAFQDSTNKWRVYSGHRQTELAKALPVNPRALRSCRSGTRAIRPVDKVRIRRLTGAEGRFTSSACTKS
jgi:hypothetical protein